MKIIPRIIYFIFKNKLRCEGCAKIKKKTTTNQKFLVEGWSIEGSITQVVEQIVINVGLLILHKTKVSIL